jgi:hypothetical protein
MKLTMDWSRLSSPALVLAVANFLLFAGISLAIGGDALNGKVEQGRYFLWGRHQAYLETTRQVYWFSKVHGFSVFILPPLALLVQSLVRRSRRAA